MGKFILRRILSLIPTIMIIIFIVYFIMDMTPGNPGRLILGDRAPIEAIEQMNEELGYNDPLLVRYFRYMGEFVTGDLGESWKSGRDVIDEIAGRLPVTVTLAVGAMLISVIVGITLGIISAVRQYSLFDFSATVIAMLLASFPGFWIGMMLILLFALHLRWLPSFGAKSIQHFILPWITTACPYIASLMRMTRTSMLEVIRSDYIRTARSKGQKESVVILKHALQNSLLPVVTILGMNLGGLLGGTVTIETVFTLNGVGTMIIEAIRAKDVPVVTGATVMLSIFFSVIMLLVDILYAYIDPRIKSRYMKKK